MKLLKEDFTQEKYTELVKYANSINSVVVDKGDYYEVKPIVKTIEELKYEKLQELKNKRDDYKHILVIKEDITYWMCDAENNIYQFSNITNLFNGFTEIDRALFYQYTNEIIDKYNFFEKEIKKSKNKEDLDLIIINF